MTTLKGTHHNLEVHRDELTRLTRVEPYSHLGSLIFKDISGES